MAELKSPTTIDGNELVDYIVAQGIETSGNNKYEYIRYNSGRTDIYIRATISMMLSQSINTSTPSTEVEVYTGYPMNIPLPTSVLPYNTNYSNNLFITATCESLNNPARGLVPLKGMNDLSWTGLWNLQLGFIGLGVTGTVQTEVFIHLRTNWK